MQAQAQLQAEAEPREGATAAEQRAAADAVAARAAAARELQRRQRQDPLQRERIAADGSLRVAPLTRAPPRPAVGAQEQPAVRPPGLAPAAPVAPPLPQERLEELVDMIAASRRVVVITGAGVSTESNIPDYRGPGGAYTTGFTPMTHSMFMKSADNRARYWYRSFCGWHEFAAARPNAAHDSLARLLRAGWVGEVVTQNVDRLHHKAGAPAERVLELHGTTHRVVCMACGHESCRHEVQAALAALNPGAAELVARIMAESDAPGRWRRALRAGTAGDARAVAPGGGGGGGGGGGDAAADAAADAAGGGEPLRRPDGDVELTPQASFAVPPCGACGGGPLKPAVTFFGDSVDPARKERAQELAAGCDLLLAVGTSLTVWSAFRLAKAAKDAGARLAIVCVGDTRADGLADWKAEALAGEVLARLAAHPRLLLPRV
ncbi:NAD-dependent deacetylase [Raphidocelis subcapitata]|uniref:NAD-dependent deacetylase n=1 Tax=Raphidocelis subcapitata TaxID=307507 RepID=A0A2V0P5P6_9CHLO|nr:NAD-dependent deacetylase [Raphidocelis subcapitata]|eukprot:GBF95194.1 NAD-dependent deacetylase [Raphidocelis subcapitata]